jgi:hypothetical protein
MVDDAGIFDSSRANCANHRRFDIHGWTARAGEGGEKTIGVGGGGDGSMRHFDTSATGNGDKANAGRLYHPKVPNAAQ